MIKDLRSDTGFCCSPGIVVFVYTIDRQEIRTFAGNPYKIRNFIHRHFEI